MLKRFFDKDDKLFGLFYHIIISLIFVIIGIIIILTFKPFNYLTYRDSSYWDNVDGLWAQISSGGAYVAFGIGFLCMYLVQFWKDGDHFAGLILVETIGALTIVFSFVCLGYNTFRQTAYILSNMQYIGANGQGSRVGPVVQSLLSAESKAKFVFFNPCFPLIFAVSMFSYAATDDNYLARLIAIVVSIVVSYVFPLVAILVLGSDLWLILAYAILVLICLLAILFNKNGTMRDRLQAFGVVLFGHSSSSGRTSSSGATGCVRYSADAEKCVIGAMNSVKGITTSTSLGYGVKVKFYPYIYVSSSTVTITVNYKLSGYESLTESKWQSVQREFSAAAERYAESVSNRAKECYGKCGSQRSYSLEVEIGSGM